MPEYPILLTLQQAAKRSGKSEKTLRRWIKEGKLITFH
jgi:predicted site-specific integrase-resolvase